MEHVEQSAPGQYTRPERLNPAARLQLTWALSWPCLLLGLGYTLLSAQSNLPSVQIRAMDVFVGVLAFFFFVPWVVRRTVQMDFVGFRLAVLRSGGGPPSRTMTYRESLSVAWLLNWRAGLIIGIVKGIVITLLGRHPDQRNVPEWCWTASAEFLLFYLWLVEAMLRKNYPYFSFTLE